MLDKLSKIEEPKERITITAPRFGEAVVTVIGTTQFCCNKMSSLNRQAIIDKQMKGGRARKEGKPLTPRDFDAMYKSSMHISKEGWVGISCSAFRNAMISACKTVGYHMTRAKLTLFVLPDGVDAEDGTPLVRLYGTPKRQDMCVRLADGGSSVVSRAFFNPWKVNLHLQWDTDQFSANDVVNLLSRAGVQVGVGAGRHDSTKSNGMGWGCFKVADKSEIISDAPVRRGRKPKAG